MSSFDKLHKHYKTFEAIAEAFKMRRQAVTYWKVNGIPSDRAWEVENKTKGVVTVMDVMNSLRLMRAKRRGERAKRRKAAHEDCAV